MEKWLPVVGWEGIYEVSDSGPGSQDYRRHFNLRRSNPHTQSER